VHCHQAVGKFTGSGLHYLESTRFRVRDGTASSITSDGEPPSPTSGSARSIVRQPPTIAIVRTQLRTRGTTEAGPSYASRLRPASRQKCASPSPRRSGVVTATLAALLCRDCGSRRRAYCRPDPRQPASASGSRSHGRAATLVRRRPRSRSRRFRAVCFRRRGARIGTSGDRPFHKPGAGCTACPRCWPSGRTAISSSYPIEHTPTSGCICRSTPTTDAHAIAPALPSPARAAVFAGANATLSELVRSGSHGRPELGARVLDGAAVPALAGRRRRG
jgi:hypothetical protein